MEIDKEKARRENLYRTECREKPEEKYLKRNT